MLKKMILMASFAVFGGNLSAAQTAAVDVSPVQPLDAQSLDTRRYIEAELDWRSYYLNRISSPRLAPTRGMPPVRDGS